MIDLRNYYATLKIDNLAYIQTDFIIFIDSNFVKGSTIEALLTVIKNSERVLGGIYHF